MADENNSDREICYVGPCAKCDGYHGGWEPCDATDTMQRDVLELLRVLGLPDQARPVSPHRVVRDEIIPAINRLSHAGPNQRLAKVLRLWWNRCTEAGMDRLEACAQPEFDAVLEALITDGPEPLSETGRARSEESDG